MLNSSVHVLPSVALDPFLMAGGISTHKLNILQSFMQFILEVMS